MAESASIPFEKLLEREDWASIQPSEELAEELEGFYELEYKYHKVRDSEWLGEPGQQEKILASMDTRLRLLAASICEKLEDVFAGWLEHHAITEPRKWAANWIETYEEQGYEYPEIMSFLDNDLKQLYNTDLDSQLRHVNLEKMPQLATFAQDLYNEVYSGWEGDDPGEENPYEDMDLKEFLENYAANYGSMTELLRAVRNNLSGIVTELAEKILFPLWLQKWEAEGIRETRETIANAWEEMREIAMYPDPEDYEIGALTAKINYFLNLAHQTGSMLEYIENVYPDVNADFLSVLSGKAPENRWTRTPEGGTPSDWEEEIARMGAGTGAFTQDIRRRIARNLAYGGPRESLKLPTAESMAVDLCLKHGLSFEEAVEALATCPIQEADGRKGPKYPTLDKHRTKLTDEERTEVMEREAIWHHGPKGEATPAVWKSVIDDKPWYVTNTHRCYQVRPTLKGAIKIFHDFVKTTA